MSTNGNIVALMGTRPARVITAAALAVALTVTPALSPTAFAVSSETEAELTDAQEQVDSATTAYNESVQKLDELQQTIDTNTAEIEQIESELPELQEKARSAMRKMYKQSKSSNDAMSFFLQSRSLDDIITTVTYMNTIQSTNLESVEALNSKQAELEEKKAELQQAQADLETEKQNAADALEEAKSARSAAQAKAEAEAAAELAAMAEDTSAAEGDGADGDNTSNTANESGQTVTTQVSASVNWNSERDTFVSQWASRIDAYLSGTPLSGYGRVFAEAAYDSGVDPRWSPAISMIESSGGRYCFRSYNAWGWMGRTFSSWDEAIRAHVSFLARNYGATLTPAAAKMYCPPTWQDWYNKVGAQMNCI
jgi:peptidoglycan DL-endopeptidase CwlO